MVFLIFMLLFPPYFNRLFEPAPEKLQKGNSEEQAPFIQKPDPENSSLEKTFKNFVSSTNKNAEKISIKSLSKIKIRS